jgi:hypothetical protein
MLYRDLGDLQRWSILAADRQVQVCCVDCVIIGLVHTTATENKVLRAIHDLCRQASIILEFGRVTLQ